MFKKDRAGGGARGYTSLTTAEGGRPHADIIL